MGLENWQEKCWSLSSNFETIWASYMYCMKGIVRPNGREVNLNFAVKFGKT